VNDGSVVSLLNVGHFEETKAFNSAPRHHPAHVFVGRADIRN
jgi:hypothetical protein